MSSPTTTPAAADAHDPFAEIERRGATPRALIGGIYSSEGACAHPHHPADPADVLAMFIYYWETSEMRELRARLDAEESERPTGFSYTRSQLLGICLASLLSDHHDLKGAHRYVQTHPELRAYLGFEPMSPEIAAARLLRGRKTPIREPNFPSRQAVVKFIDEWLAKRADWVLPLLEDLVQRVAFDNILDYQLDASRLVFDTAPIYSGHTRDARRRKADEGARKWGRKHERGFYGRLHVSIVSGDIPFILWLRPVTPEAEAVLARELIIPQIAVLSEKLVEAARARGISDYPGFHRAALFGDSAFSDDETAGIAYEHGLEPAFTPKSGGRTRVLGDLLLKEVGTSRTMICQLSSRGRVYCSCPGNKKKPARTAKKKGSKKAKLTGLEGRKPMIQVTNRFGKDFHLRCPKCGATYYATSRKPDKKLRGDHWKRGKRDRTVLRTLRYDDPRAIAISHLAREVQEESHSAFRHMGLLMKERASSRKHITGNFRHHFWYLFGALIHNLLIERNLAQGLQREEWDVHELYLGGLRNGAAATRRKQQRGQSPQALPQRVPDPALEPPPLEEAA